MTNDHDSDTKTTQMMKLYRTKLYRTVTCDATPFSTDDREGVSFSKAEEDGPTSL